MPTLNLFLTKYRHFTLAVLVTVCTLLVGALVGTEQYLIPIVLILVLLFGAVGLPNWRWLAVVALPLFWTWTRVELPFVSGLLSTERLIVIPIAIGFVYEVVLQRKKLPRLPAGGGVALGIFMAVLCIGLINTPSIAGLSWFIRLGQKILLAYIVFYVLVKTDLTTLRHFTNYLVIAVFIACLFGVIMLAVFGTTERLTQRLDGIWLIPSSSVIALHAVAPVALFVFAEIAQARAPLKKLFFSIAMLVMLLVPTLTLVRRQTLIFTPLAVLAVILFSRRQQRVVSLTLLGVIALLFFYVILPTHDVWAERYIERVVEQEIEEESRFIQVQSGLAALRESPVVGYGLGRTVQITARYTNLAGYKALSASHNAFLTMMIDTGLLGFGATILVWGSLLWGTWQALRRPLSGYLADAVRVLPGLLVFIGAQWMVGDMLRWNSNWIMFGLAWAIIWYALQADTISTENPDL